MRRRPVPVSRIVASRLCGWLLRTRPSRIGIPFYVRHYGVNREEILGSAAAYGTLGAFFSRPLAAGTRPVCPEPGAWVAPCDGTLAQAGPLFEDRLIQAKGLDYSLRELLAGDSLAEGLRGGAYVTLYLSPGDYHRVHAPVAGTIRRVRRIDGTLFPVNARARMAIPDLYVRNERVIVILDTAVGALVVVLVGAYLVGSIVLTFPGAPGAHGGQARPLRAEGSVPLATPVGRGDELAQFRIGSTVIVLAPAGLIDPVTLPPLGSRVRMGMDFGPFGRATRPKPVPGTGGPMSL